MGPKDFEELKQPQVIVFDLGDVLVRVSLQKIFEQCGVDPEAGTAFIEGEHGFNYDRGVITSEEFFQRFKNALGYERDYETFCRDFCCDVAFELDDEMSQFFNDLKMCYQKTTQFWILSNINELHYQHVFRRRWPGLLDSFWMKFLSHKMGCRKPEPDIYNQMLQQGRVSAYTCVFIDDREENGEYPKHIGMPFILFRDLPQLKQSLKIFGINVDES